MKKSQIKPNGQILVLLAILFVVILGFVSLAIDGGIIMADRRNAQSGADSTALAGAGEAAGGLKIMGITSGNFNCSSPDLYNNVMPIAQAAAIIYAERNGYTIGQSLTNKNGVVISCNQANKYLDVTVMITTTVKTFFTSMFTTAPIKNEVTAVARLHPVTSGAAGYAFVALNPSCGSQDGIDFSGSGTLRIHNAGMFSNCRLRGTGTIDVITDTANNYVGVGGFTVSGGASITVPPTQTSALLPTMTIPTPDCAALPNMGSSTHGGPITPGRYTTIAVTGGDPPLLMSPGLYCLYGDFKAIGTSSVTGNGITLYMAAGEVNVTGTGAVSLTAADPPGVNRAIPGLLIYMPESNPAGDQLISLTGSGATNFRGTVYAPKGRFDISGSANNMGLQVIAWDIDITGSGTMDINYDEDFFYSLPPRLELLK